MLHGYLYWPYTPSVLRLYVIAHRQRAHYTKWREVLILGDLNLLSSAFVSDACGLSSCTVAIGPVPSLRFCARLFALLFSCSAFLAGIHLSGTISSGAGYKGNSTSGCLPHHKVDNCHVDGKVTVGQIDPPIHEGSGV